MYVCRCTVINTYMYICIHMMCIMCIYKYLYTYIYIYAHKRTQTNTHTHTHARTQTQTQTQTHKQSERERERERERKPYTQRHTNTRKHIYTCRTCIHMYPSLQMSRVHAKICRKKSATEMVPISIAFFVGKISWSAWPHLPAHMFRGFEVWNGHDSLQRQNWTGQICTREYVKFTFEYKFTCVYGISFIT